MKMKPYIYKGTPFSLQFSVYSGDGTGSHGVPLSLAGWLISVTLRTNQSASALNGYVTKTGPGGDFTVSVLQNTFSFTLPATLSERLGAGKLDVQMRIGKSAWSIEAYETSYSPFDIIDPLAQRVPDDIPCYRAPVIIENCTYTATLVIEEHTVGEVTISSVTITSTGEIHVALDNGQTLSPGLIKGADGKSAYKSALEAGYAGTETEWVKSLQGEYVPQLEWRIVKDSEGQFIEVRPLCALDNPILSKCRVALLRYKKHYRRLSNEIYGRVKKFNVMDDLPKTTDADVWWTQIRIKPIPYDTAAASARSGWLRLPWTLEQIFERRVEIRPDAEYVLQQLAVIHRGGRQSVVKCQDGIDRPSGLRLSLGSFISGVCLLRDGDVRGKPTLFRIGRWYNSEIGQYSVYAAPCGQSRRKRAE